MASLRRSSMSCRWSLPWRRKSCSAAASRAASAKFLSNSSEGWTMLEIRDLHVKVGNQQILQGVDLKVNAGEVHAIMGPNGSGKSTLAQVLAGRESYEVTAGGVVYEGENLLEMGPEGRAGRGGFLGLQLPGVN